MSDIELNWDGGNDPEALRDDLEAFADAVNRHLYEAVETWVLMVEATAKQLAPVDSGRLRSSINSDVRQVGQDLIRGFIGTNVSYAPYIEEGRGRIEASGDGALHFFVDGEEVFAQSVGPAEAQPFLEPAIQQHISDLRELFDEALANAAAEVRAA